MLGPKPCASKIGTVFNLGYSDSHDGFSNIDFYNLEKKKKCDQRRPILAGFGYSAHRIHQPSGILQSFEIP
jgi:hypothetical protein